jgi:hypothetical protein
MRIGMVDFGGKGKQREQRKFSAKPKCAAAGLRIGINERSHDEAET